MTSKTKTPHTNSLIALEAEARRAGMAYRNTMGTAGGWAETWAGFRARLRPDVADWFEDHLHRTWAEAVGVALPRSGLVVASDDEVTAAKLYPWVVEENTP